MMDLIDVLLYRPLFTAAVLVGLGMAVYKWRVGRREHDRIGANVSEESTELGQHQRQGVEEGAKPTEVQPSRVAETPGEGPAMSAHSQEVDAEGTSLINPGKVFAYLALGLLFLSWLGDLGSIQFRAIFLAVTILVIAGLAYNQHENGGPFWPRNPLILPVRAAQGLGLAVFWTAAYLLQVIGATIALVVGGALLLGVLFALGYFFTLWFGGDPSRGP